jgi:hypothetical protein
MGGGLEYDVAWILRRFDRGQEGTQTGVVGQKELPLSGVFAPMLPRWVRGRRREALLHHHRAERRLQAPAAKTNT